MKTKRTITVLAITALFLFGCVISLAQQLSTFNKVCMDRGHVKVESHPMSIVTKRVLIDVDNFSYFELKDPLEEHFYCSRCYEYIVLKTYTRDTIWVRPVLSVISTLRTKK